jgi:uncharacterized membrane protein YcjF (UPF0283 family)
MTPQCQFVFERWKNLAFWRNLWTMLLFIFGVAVVIFLCMSIFLFIRETWVVGAVTTVGTIASGAAIKWVVSRRNEAVQEEKGASKEVKEVCVTPTPSGTRALATPTPTLLPEVQNKMDEIERRQRILFGSIR